MRQAYFFTEFLQARVQKTSAERFYYSKRETKDVARDVGLRVAEVLAVFVRPEEVSFDFDLPFVVKPTHSASRNGVRILVERRENDGRLRDLMNGKWMSKKFIRDRMRRLFDMRPNPENRVIIEEFIVGENQGVPFDYKMYVIGGKVRFILQLDRNTDPASFAFFTDDFVPATADQVVLGPKAQAGENVVPRNAAAVLDAGRRVANHINASFASVDVYTNGEQVTLGEITYCPGGPYFGNMFRFTPEFDRFMGDELAAAGEAMGIERPWITRNPPVLDIEQQQSDLEEI